MWRRPPRPRAQPGSLGLSDKVPVTRGESEDHQRAGDRDHWRQGCAQQRINGTSSTSPNATAPTSQLIAIRRQLSQGREAGLLDCGDEEP